jgi:NitT/TauT family transport system substrate-binding protein
MGHHRNRAPLLIALAATPLLAGASSTTEPAEDEWVSEDRCAANADAGTITFLSGFGYAAAASMVDVFVAERGGYYDELCLDVEVVSSFSTANYPLVAAGEAQFASAGSFSEVVEFGAVNDADLVTLVVEGRFPIDALIVKPGAAETLEGLAGSTIGVKGAMTRSVAAMLAGAGLVDGR